MIEEEVHVIEEEVHVIEEEVHVIEKEGRKKQAKRSNKQHVHVSYYMYRHMFMVYCQCFTDHRELSLCHLILE